MCGIAGWIGPGDRRDSVRRMHEAMRHRGPDGDGVWFSADGSAGLAHRRLAILAPGPQAAQPMEFRGHRLVFNGEIYNHAALRGEMPGSRFEIPGSDTEVLLKLCVSEGSRALPRLRGMFAFALHDEASGTVLLARDPFGIKPLYFSEVHGGLLFASELRTILASGLVSRRVDARAAAGFFQTGSVPEPLTMVEGVRMFPPGCFAVWSPGHALDIRPFREPAFHSEPSGARAPVEAVRSALQSSVRAHLISDVPVGIFLSGGIDSGAVAALAAGHPEVTAYSLVFSQKKFTEEARIRESAHLRGIPLRELHLGELTAREWFSDFLGSLDQPSVDGFNTYCVSRWAASQGAKVILSGLGGDELFGGYPSFSSVPRVRNLGRAAQMSGSVGALAGAALDMLRLPPKARRIAAWLEAPAGWRSAYALVRGVFSAGETRSLLRQCGLPASEYRDTLPLPDLSADREMVSCLEATRYMRNQLLRDSDVMSMAHGLELRVPFVDADLWEAVSSIAPDVRFSPGKSLLVGAVPELPESVRTAKKQGFTLPIEEWSSMLDAGACRSFSRGIRPGTWARRMGLAVFRDWVVRHGMDAAEGFESRQAGRPKPRRAPGRPMLLMAPTLGNEPGGIQEFTREMVWALKESGGLSGIAALSYNGSAPAPMEFAEWADCGKAVSREAAFFFQALRLCLKWRPQLILSTFPKFAPVGVACSRLTGVPFVTVAHGIEVWSRLRVGNRWALRSASQILAVSRFTAKMLARINGVPPERIRIFPNTVDTENFSPGPKPSRWADRLEIPASASLLLTVARLDASERSKGVELIWDAMEAGGSGKLGSAAHIVVGAGSDLERLRGEATRRGLASRVRFTGPVSCEELPELYRLADAFVMPSTKEGFGIVFLEAMSSGVPVVAADAGGAPDALQNGKLGWLADPGSPKSLAACIEAALAADPRDPRRDPQALRSSVKEHFGREAFRGRLEAVLREMIR